MMSKLKIVLDKQNKKLILGGYAVTTDTTNDIKIFKILGLYEGFMEGFNIVNKDIEIINQELVAAAKLTIDNMNVAKESYRIFISNLDDEYEYTVKSYLRKPKHNEKAEIIDLRLLNSRIFSNLLNKDIKIGDYNFDHHNYNAFTEGNFEIHIRRAQFVLKENNKIDIAILKHIN